MRLTLAQVFHGLFYAPNYVARALGYFRQEGIEVALRIADPPSSIIEMLSSGQADIVLAGPARLLYRGAEKSAEKVSCIGQGTAGSFFFLVSPDTQVPFALSQLLGSKLLLFPGTPTPWPCLQYLLRSRGLDPSLVEILRPVTPELSIRTYISGAADFIEVPEPYLERLLDELGEQRVVAIGPLLGPVPFTIYLADRDRVHRDPEHFTRFLRAIARAGRWVQETPAERVGETIAELFPEVPIPIIARAIARYQRQGLWTDIPYVKKAELDRLYTVLTGEAIAPPDLYRKMVHSGIV